jgi:hypothetical protein
VILLTAAVLVVHAGISVPDSVKQGEVLRVRVEPGGPSAAVAVFRGKTVPLFRQPSGELLAFVPVAVPTPSGSYPLLVKSSDGQALVETTVSVLDARYRVQNIRATRAMKSLTPLPGEVETMRELHRLVTPERRWSDTLVNPTLECESSPFGVKRMHNGKPTGNFHRGVDLASPMGTPVRAAAGGVVRVSRMFNLHGGTIGIDHGQGVTSHYLHLSELLRQEGEIVKQGDIVANVGSTGFATGPHLHWGFSVHGEAVNPAQWGAKVAPCPVGRSRRVVPRRKPRKPAGQ